MSQHKKTIAIYPGSFDPMTNGHLDIIERSVHLFDEVVLAVAQDNNKESLFGLEERMTMMRESTAGYENVSVEVFGGLLIHYAKQKGAAAIIRGLRAVSDFEYEFQMALMNRRLDSGVETVFLMTSAENAFISSTMIKQVATLGGEIRGMVPPAVERRLADRFKGGK